jgi:hypothetical protein
MGRVCVDCFDTSTGTVTGPRKVDIKDNSYQWNNNNNNNNIVNTALNIDKFETTNSTGFSYNLNSFSLANKSANNPRDRRHSITRSSISLIYNSNNNNNNNTSSNNNNHHQSYSNGYRISHYGIPRFLSNDKGVSNILNERRVNHEIHHFNSNEAFNDAEGGDDNNDTENENENDNDNDEVSNYFITSSSSLNRHISDLGNSDTLITFEVQEEEDDEDDDDDNDEDEDDGDDDDDDDDDEDDNSDDDEEEEEEEEQEEEADDKSAEEMDEEDCDDDDDDKDVDMDTSKPSLNERPIIYRCKSCYSDICHSSLIISKDFWGNKGEAYFVKDVLNVKEDNKEIMKNMRTGQYGVKSISCIQCDNVIGWKYITSVEYVERYKVNKYVIEKNLLKTYQVPV